jgi:hypothetical protein
VITAGRWAATVVTLLAVALLTVAAQAREPVEAIQAETEIPEHLLLDVGIQVFDPGLGDEDESALEEKGIYAEVRKSEARYIPFQLKSTLEGTGQWGAVRVIPAGVESVDVTISGEILTSTGHDMALKIRILDATGRVWRARRYQGQADSVAYDPERVEVRDPYQDLYNRIANDLLAGRERLKPGEIPTIREVSRLRFGADLAPMAFGDYLSVNRKGRYIIEKLPARDDPMMSRIAVVRERDYMFVDTLNEYYADFYLRMEEPYYDWRQYSYEEEEAFREMRRKARKRKWVGGLLILAGVLSDSSSSAGSAARDAAVIGGVATIQSGVNKSKEAKIHREALRELAASFDAEMAPLVVEVEGETLELQGSAETQFAEWRRLLREIFVTETGLPTDPDADPDDLADGTP